MPERHAFSRKSREAQRAIARALERWFANTARDLPWRHRHPDPNVHAYRVLVSEYMLQQTQVSRVVDRFQAFTDRFPTVADLAGASEQEVLSLWQGLGYYRRAMHLHRAARHVIAEHRGAIPQTVESLRTLPGVGRYTAGAVASIAFDQRTPLVDGNVTRVALRVTGNHADPAAPATVRKVWEWAEALVLEARSPSALNQSLMELGATVCTPRRPNCALCPLRARCVALSDQAVGRIPRPKPKGRVEEVEAEAYFIVRRGDRAILLEKRPAQGMWASMWQLPTREGAARLAVAGCGPQARGRTTVRVGNYTHRTTHRQFRFELHVAAIGHPVSRSVCAADHAWVTAGALHGLPLSNAQKRLIQMALEHQEQECAASQDSRNANTKNSKGPTRSRPSADNRSDQNR